MRRGLADRRRICWSWLAVGVAAATLTNVLLPDGAAVLDALYLGFIAASAAVIFVATVIQRPPAAVRRGWSVLGAGVVLYLAGEATWVSYARRGVDPFPSIADVAFVGGSLVMIIGVTLLVASRRQHVDRTTGLDTAIVAGGIGAILWVLLVAPYASDPEVTLVEQVVSASYPMMDVLLVAVVARLALAGGGIPVALRILLAGLVTLTVTDVAYYSQELAGTYVEWGAVDFSLMLAFAVISAAALHPGAGRLHEHAETPAPLGVGRFVFLSTAAAAPLVLSGVGGALGLEVSGPVLPIASAVLVVLVVARTWSLMTLTERVVELRDNKRFHSIIQHSSDAIVVVDGHGAITYASPTLEVAWGWGDGELLGQPLGILVDPPGRAVLLDAIQRLGDGDDDALETRWVTGDGTPRDVNVTLSDLRDDPQIEGVVLTARDVSTRVELEARLRHDAGHDALTELANRRAFEQAVAALDAADAGRSFLVFVDVDDFKLVNDTHGHARGDLLLRTTAARLRSEVRPDDVVARLGGDEFGVLLRAVDRVHADRTVARIAACLAEPIEADGAGFRASYSLGWTAAEVGAIETSLRRADLAMYEAKRSGKGRAVCFSDGLLDAAERELEVRRRLADAVANDELEVVYQPIVRMVDGRVTGHEALMRWNPPSLGKVFPDTFIPLAEETGDIVAMGRWILERACRDAVDWQGEDGGEPLVSVNVSTVQVADDAFRDHVAGALAASGLPADRLQLELTESRMADEDVAARFEALSELGVRLAIDDFGTGYCSLGYLQRFGVDVIKVDRSFVTGAGEDTALLEGIVGLVAGLGATAVAEGVETQQDHDNLRRLGVAMAQGWHHGRPVPHRPGALAPGPAASRSTEPDGAGTV